MVDKKIALKGGLQRAYEEFKVCINALVPKA